MEELVTAWTLWSTGPLDPEHKVWGFSLYVWARIGKLLQAASIFVVVLEVIGHNRLAKFGKQLHGLSSFKQLRQRALKNLHYQCTEMTLPFRTPPWRLDQEYGRNFTENPGYHHRMFLLPFIATFTVWVIDYVILDIGVFGVLGYFLIHVNVAFVLPLILGWATMIALLAGFLSDYLFIKPVSCVMAHKQLNNGLKVSTLVAALVGIHFDLLAS